MSRLKGAVIISALAIIILSLTVCNGYTQTAEDESMKKGTDLIRHDKFDEAITEFNKVITANPKSTAAYYNLGFAYDKKGDLSNAISYFNKAIEIDATLADAYYNRGSAYYKKGNFDNAITDYNKVIEISPASADAHYGLGLAYSKKGDQDKAISEYTAAIKTRPDFTLAYDARAVVYVMKKNYIGAMADVNKAQSLGFRSRRIKRSGTGLTNAGGISTSLPASESTKGRQTQAALMTAGAIFLLVGFSHLLRLLFRVRLMVGKFIIPVWLSAIVFLILLFFSAWMFKSI